MIGSFLRARRGVAAVEFAFTCPMLLLFVGGLADFGLALADQSRLAGAVAQGAQYAYLHPTTVTVAAMQAVVTAGAALPGVTVVPVGPTRYCVVGSFPPVLTAGSTTTNCADGSSAGLYVKITARYVYPALMPGYSHLVGTTLTETVTARIQ
jgi:Flp pilus assembly protein TadG